jgi:hypothetical protein
MGMIRYKRITGAYRIINKYYNMKTHKGSGKSIIATARKMSTIVWTMLKNRQPFDPLKMIENKEYHEVQAAVIDAALAS